METSNKHELYVNKCIKHKLYLHHIIDKGLTELDHIFSTGKSSGKQEQNMSCTGSAVQRLLQSLWHGKYLVWMTKHKKIERLKKYEKKIGWILSLFGRWGSGVPVGGKCHIILP